MVRGKFKVVGVKHVDWNPDVRIIELSAVSNDGTPENERFHKYTPSGSITMTVDNPVASDQLILGETFYVDFTLAPK